MDQEFNDLENEMASKENAAAAMIKTPRLKIGIASTVQCDILYAF